MISAEELRKLQKEESIRRETEYSLSFKNATDKYYNIIMEEAKKAISISQKTDRSYIILDHVPLIRNVDTFQYTRLLYGLWNKHTHKFDPSIFEKYCVVSPFSRAVEDLDKFGYKLENVSKPTKPYHLHLKISW
jgi:hypothetical protein